MLGVCMLSCMVGGILYELHVQHFVGRLSEENRQDVPCGFVSTSSGLFPTLWLIQCTCTLQNHKVRTLSVFF